MKISNIIFCGLFILLFSNCKNKIDFHSSVEHYNLANLNVGNINDIFDSLEYTPLRFEKDTYPNMCIQIEITDSFIYITDKNDLIHIFDDNGHYVSCSKNKRGNGPGEYEILMGLFQGNNPDEINILTPFRMLTYDKYFNTISDFHLPTRIGQNAMLYNRGFSLGNNKYFLLPSPTSEDPERIDVYDSEKEEIIKSMHYPKEVVSLFTMQNTCFYYMPDSTLVFCPPAYSNYIYKISEDSLKPYISISYGSEMISKEELHSVSEGFRKQNEYMINSDRDIPIRSMLNSKIILSVIKKGNQKDGHWYTIATNRKKTETSTRVNHTDTEGQKFPAIINVDEKFAYSLITKEFLLSNPTLLLNKKDSAEEGLKDIEGEDLVLLKYKFCE